MLKHRLAYFLTVAFLWILLFFFSNYFLLAVGIIMLILPLCVFLFMKLSAEKINVSYEMRSACVAGQKTEIKICVKKEGIDFANAFIKITLSSKNVLFRYNETRNLLISISGKQKEYIFSFVPEFCGELHIIFEKVESYDILGICKVAIKVPEERMIIVHPEGIPLKIVKDNMFYGKLQGETFNQNKKGKDPSEVFDLREYKPGDDVRSLHWKLSSKLDTLIVREASEHSNYNVVVLFDAGFEWEGKDINRKVVASAVNVCVAVSDRLIGIGIPHSVLIPNENGIHQLEVLQKIDYMNMVDEFMGMHLQNNGGIGLKYLISEKWDRKFTKIIYVTAGGYDNNTGNMLGNKEVTIVCVTEKGDKIQMDTEHGKRIIRIPLNAVYDNHYNIAV